MSRSSWTETRLFQQIEDPNRAGREPEAKSIAAWLTLAMPSIEALLRSAGTSPTDFTLHNDEHAFRVAELMAKLIPPQALPLLTTYELELLLLSAYLHDIGMTPKQRRVNGLMVWALGGEPVGLPPNDLSDFQDWLTASPSFKKPTPNDPLFSERARFAWARKAVAHYCRYKHNDWSAEWIRSELAPTADFSGAYGAFIDDLVALCRSHHEGYAELSSARFDPRLVGNNRLVHHRYLACILRMADVCEVDPERTPEVLLTHRDIDPSSLPFWHKDHDLTIDVSHRAVRLVAYPNRALIHRAIEETADQIEDELRLCERLAAERPFASLPFRGIAAPQYEWTLTPYLHRTVTPRAGTYVYVDGSFRPNTEKVLQLLGSQELYSEPIAAVRELLQNAFDAVLERLAREWLLQSEVHGQSYSELQRAQSVVLEFAQSEDGYHLRCSDTGAGMNKAIICDHLLVSGTAVRADIERLERRCRERGTTIGRTAKFGIGVLSYFLLASDLEIETRRLPVAGDDDGTAWRFRTTGVGSFGELSRGERVQTGSTVDLTLRSNLIQDSTDWWRELREYMRATLIRVPCHFILRSSVEGCTDGLRLEPGWTRRDQQLTDIVLAAENENEDDGAKSLPEKKKLASIFETSASRRRDAHIASRARAIREFGSRIRWHVGDELAVAGLGRVRIHVPYFDLAGGKSFVFLDEEARATGNSDHVFIRGVSAFRVGRDVTHGLTIDGELLMSWKGMRVHGRTITKRPSNIMVLGPGPSNGVLVEMDFEDEEIGRLGLSREWVQFPKDTDEWALVRKVSQHVLEQKRGLREMLADSPFLALAYGFGTGGTCPDDKLFWLRRSEGPGAGEEQRFVWERVQFPLTVASSVWNGESGDFTLSFQGGELRCYEDMSCADVGGRSGRGRFLPKPASRMAGIDLQERGVVVVPVWDSGEATGECGYDGWSAARFPPEWSAWVGFLGAGAGMVWNRGHSMVAQHQWMLAKEMRGEPIWHAPIDDLNNVRRKCEDREFARAVLLDLIGRREIERWNGIVERDPRLADLLWRSAGEEKVLQFVWQQIDKDGSVKNTTFAFERSGARKDERLVIARPSGEWLVTRQNSR